MVLKNLLFVDGQYHADLVDVENDRIIPVYIQKGGGNCEWTAMQIDPPCNTWEIKFVGANKLDIKDWEDGDMILLGISIR